MAVFKFVISDKKHSGQVEKDQKDCPILGKRIGDTIQGDFLGLEGYEMKVTGGSDRDGFPMRRDIEGTVRKRFMASEGTGFRPEKEGLRKRRMFRGNTISHDVSQINCSVVKQGSKALEELLPRKAKEQKEEKKE
ncbi:MAG: 30S ribosomal protein S6e [Candidatus Aenigmarchaeota archaeon]|nr:30S ribosomal protein S6e [Candidatus Aenigmarchaeota archaeon]